MESLAGDFAAGSGISALGLRNTFIYLIIIGSWVWAIWMIVRLYAFHTKGDLDAGGGVTLLWAVLRTFLVAAMLTVMAVILFY